MLKETTAPRVPGNLLKGLVALGACLTLTACSGGEPAPESERTDPPTAPRGGDMLSTQVRAGQRATQALNQANEVRKQQINELDK
jgi:hypothetical protein